MHADTDVDSIVLTRFFPGEWDASDGYAMADDELARDGLLVDAETTGKDPLTCNITQLACVPFTYDARTAAITSVGPGESWLNDPGEPIPPNIVELAGITNEMVRGQRIDVARVEFLLAGAALVISHHADFDRRVTERVVPGFARVHWACSYKDVAWRDRFGARCAVLEHLMRDQLRQFYDAHRALDDCHAALHLLAHATADGRTAFAHLLESARQPTYRLWALDWPYDAKDLLKNRGFAWSDGKDGKRKGWYFDGDEAAARAEFAWLKDQPFLCKRVVQTISRLDRFSVREDAAA